MTDYLMVGAGLHRESGSGSEAVETFSKGDVVSSDRELDKLFPGKFEPTDSAPSVSSPRPSKKKKSTAKAKRRKAIADED